jgi:hypothetical protein
MRCLHVCFLPRSSSRRDRAHARLSYVERIAGGRRERLRRRALELVGQPEESWWKLNKYAQGDEVTVSVEGFFPDGT